jgi:hypothetical protein
MHPGEEDVGCGNWLYIWLMGNPKRRLTWVWPEHASWQGAPELPALLAPDIRERIEVIKFEDIGKDNPFSAGKAEAVHVCRSGCWTPPWLDEDFLQFVGERWDPYSARVLLDKYDEAWSPLRIRWDEERLAQVLEHRRTVDEMMKLDIEHTVLHNSRNHPKVSVPS